ncbi:MAG TPA: Calx-beta domain-containing protein, partial [Candidatus Dormibacteraeota bacterium]|nr:Calx-beta domain-containing protein [Candidatus Dormibacteraeota bacterium]
AAISTLDFTISGAGVEEVGSTIISLPVYRSGALDQTVTVQYATHDGTAVGGLDYVPVSGTLTFNPGESFKTITINGLDDSIAEGTESFSVALSNPSPNAVLGFNPVSYLYVIDNECLANLVAASFDPGAGAAPPIPYLYALAVQEDGKILVGVTFTEWNQVARPNLARLLPDGSLDTSFVPDLGTAARVNAILVEPDGKIVVAGLFNLAGHVNIVRLNSDGSVDKTFAATLPSDSWPASLARQSSGKILVAGGTPIAGDRHPLIRRFNLSGTRDNSFTLTPLADAAGIQRIVVRPDDKIVAAGSFGPGLGSVILLSANGARDPGFGGPAADGLQLALALEVQADGKVLVGGAPQYNGSTGPLLRLNADGSP